MGGGGSGLNNGLSDIGNGRRVRQARSWGAMWRAKRNVEKPEHSRNNREVQAGQCPLTRPTQAFSGRYGNALFKEVARVANPNWSVVVTLVILTAYVTFGRRDRGTRPLITRMTGHFDTPTGGYLSSILILLFFSFFFSIIIIFLFFLKNLFSFFFHQRTYATHYFRHVTVRRRIKITYHVRPIQPSSVSRWIFHPYSIRTFVISIDKINTD